MAVGGIPKYLSYIKQGQSSAQIIQNLCFNPRGPLTTEFDVLYESLFDNHQLHIRIIKALAEHRNGLSFTQISKNSTLYASGNLTKALKELIASDFIRFIPFLGKKRREGRYRLVDEYSLFYIRWIRDNLINYDESLSENFWIKQHSSNKYKIWAGYTFENICLKHISAIVESLKISVVAERMSYWSYRAKNDNEKGAQIDLIIDRSDQCMNLCEIKFYSDTFTIDQDYGKKLNARREIFRKVSGTRKSLFNTLITPYGASLNKHYLSSIENQLTLENLFQ